jgi:hypothetical protein
VSRLTVCISVDAPDEEPAFASWLRANGAHVRRLSTNTGCGCCVLLYDLEVGEGAAALPSALCAQSSWTQEGAFSGEDSTVETVLAQLDGGSP